MNYDRPYNYPHPMDYNDYYPDTFQHNGWQSPYPPSYQQLPQQNHITSPFEQFAKPQPPPEWYSFPQTKPQLPPKKGLHAYFQDEDGQLDYNKMFSTVGQLGNTIQQISPVIKQIGSIVKIFK